MKSETRNLKHIGNSLLWRDAEGRGALEFVSFETFGQLSCFEGWVNFELGVFVGCHKDFLSDGFRKRRELVSRLRVVRDPIAVDFLRGR
jgi:hypothetical protein